MSIEQIRTDLIALLTPLIADGGEIAAYAPESANVFPSIWLGDTKAAIKTAVNFRSFDYLLPLTVAVARKGVFADERASTTALLPAILDLIDADFTLGGSTYGVSAREFTEGSISLGGDQLVGFTLFFSIKEDGPVSLE